MIAYQHEDLYYVIFGSNFNIFANWVTPTEIRLTEEIADEVIKEDLKKGNK